MSRVKIIILAKAPIANFSKTRLIPDLGEECTAVLARKLFYHTIKGSNRCGYWSCRIMRNAKLQRSTLAKILYRQSDKSN